MKVVDKIWVTGVISLVVLGFMSTVVFPKEGATGMDIVESAKQKYMNGGVFAEGDMYTIDYTNITKNLNLTKEQELELMNKYVEDVKMGRISVEVDHIVAEYITRSIEKHTSDKNNYYTQNGVKKKVEPELIRAIMKRESNFNPTVVSKSGAMGLMQIMPATAKWLKLDNPWDIDENIKAGIVYLRDRLTEYNGEYSLALASYNAGQGSVNGWLKDSRYSKNGRLTYIPFAETRAYVPYVLKQYNIYKGQK